MFIVNRGYYEPIDWGKSITIIVNNRFILKVYDMNRRIPVYDKKDNKKKKVVIKTIPSTTSITKMPLIL